MKCPNCQMDNFDTLSVCLECGWRLPLSPVKTLVSNFDVSLSEKPNSPPEQSVPSNGVTVDTDTDVDADLLQPGAPLQQNRYIIQKKLGQGGMGAVHLAVDTRLANKLVVVKELLSDTTDLIQMQADIHNFTREVEVLASLDHPYVPQVTDHFQDGSHYFMVQEYVAGENLEDYMERRNQPLDEHEALRYASDVLDILDYLAHQTPPIVHRDIKPANIIIGARDHHAYLVDFGIARADITVSRTNRKQTTAIGTPGYAPPEQYQGKADSRSDLYALAATLHHLLTNNDPADYPPFTYPPVRSLNPTLSVDVEQILTTALIENRYDRYQSAQVMKQDIDAILSKPPTAPNYAVAVPSYTGVQPRQPQPVQPAYTSTPPRSSNSSTRTTMQFIGLICTSVAVLLALISSCTRYYSSSQPSTSYSFSQSGYTTVQYPTPTPDPTITLITNYYTAIEQQNYSLAYSYLASNAQIGGKHLSLNTFTQLAKNADKQFGLVAQFDVNSISNGYQAAILRSQKTYTVFITVSSDGSSIISADSI